MRKKILFVIAVLLLFYSVIFVFDESKIKFLTKEDGIIESIGALWYLFASIILIILYYRDKTGYNLLGIKSKRNIFYLLLGLLLFVAFGEEISWGQRIFNFETAESIKEINAQEEFNIHNLKFLHGDDEYGNAKKGIQYWLTAGTLFFLFWVIYCVVLPILSKLSVWISNFLKNVNIPIIPLWLSAMFVLNYFLSRIVGVLSNMNTHAVVEIKEANTAFLFFVVALTFMLAFNKTNFNADKVND